MVVVFLLLSIFALGVSRKRYKSFFAPLGIYALVWGLALIGYYANPLGYIEPYPKTSVAFFFSYLAFIAGCLLVRIPLPVDNGTSGNAAFSDSPRLASLPKKRSLAFFVHDKPSTWYVQLLTYLGFAITVVYMVNTIRYYGWETMLSAGYKIRMEYTISANMAMGGHALEYSFWFGLPIVYAAAILNLAIIVYTGRARLYAVLPIISGLSFDLSTQGRSMTLDMFILYGFAILLSRQLKRPPEWAAVRGVIQKRTLLLFLVIGALSIALFLQIGSSRHPEWGTGPSENIFGRYEVLAPIAHSANYLIGPLATFNVVFNIPGNHELWYGRNTFYNIERIFTRYLHLKIFDDLPISVTQYQDGVYNGYAATHNTYSYLRYLWDDWGYLGILIGPFMLGYLSTWAWSMLMRGFNYYRFITTLIFMNVIVLSPTILNFANHTILWAIPLVWLSPTFRSVAKRRGASVVRHKCLDI